MKNFVKSPLNMDHYTFMEQFLDDDRQAHIKTLQNEQASQQDRANALQALNKKLNDELAALNAQPQPQTEIAFEHSQKLKLVLETLSTPEKKETYDAALKTSKSNLIIQSDTHKRSSLLALVPLKDIENEFTQFIEEQKKAWPPSKGAFPEGNFKSELKKGPPEVLTLTFPDEASAKAFIQRLFDKNMAMFPGGSQDIHDFDKQQKASKSTQHFKGELEAGRQEETNPTTTTATPRS